MTLKCMNPAHYGGIDMTAPADPKDDDPLEASIPEGGAPLESILCTEELQRRPSRPPDYEKENGALVKLVSALADSPQTIFQTLAETILDVTQGDSAGLSLLTRDGRTPHADGKRFYWPAIAGMWNPHVGGGTPRNFGPCGDVLDKNCTLLFTHFERRYPYLMPVSPAAEECLLVPFYVAGEAVGTIWSIMHSDRRKFDAEDDRVMASLGKFASSAYQALAHIEDLKVQVAEREKAEAEVRELASGLQAKVRRLVEANVVGIVMWNLDGAITEANEAFLRIVQYNHEDLASGRLRWTDLTPPEWRDRDGRAITELKATGIFQPFEKEYFRKDGSRVPILLGGALFEGGGNEGVAFILDLSEQKRAEEALRRSEADLTEAQRLSHTGSWHWNVTSGEVVWSQEAFAIFGFDPEKDTATYQLYLERIHPEDRPGIEEARWAAVAQKGDFEAEYRLLLPAGGMIKYVHSIGHFSQNQSGEIEYVGAIMDTTDRKRAEEERERLRRAQAELAHLNRVSTMGELTASLAHEIKQPISAAVTNAQTCLRLLGRDKPDVGEAEAAASRLVQDITRASEITSRIRSLFQRGAPKRELVDINELIRGMITLLRSEAATHSVSIHDDLASGLPKVMGDRVQLQQVLMNLMLNGIGAMQEMSRPGKLTITSRQGENRQLLVSIADTGVGLRPDQVGQIFDVFYTTKSHGTGMGLPISRSIIESHGGRLWVAPSSGHGAVFQFALPVEGKTYQVA
jgi:PAS domain S-box-containing protein